MLVVGLTGGIGSGKSTVAALFAQKNIPIIDTDHLSRELTQPESPALHAIIEHFGEDFLREDGTLDRTRLRKRIFDHEKDRRWLEKLLHPLILKAVHEQVASCRAPYCIVVIPLLTESPPDPIIQRILVIDAHPETQISRAQKRDHHDPHAHINIPAIQKSQASRESRLKIADDIIQNEGNMADLEINVEKMHEMYLQISKKNQKNP